MLIVAVVVMAFLYRQFFPKVEVKEYTTVQWVHDTVMVRIPTVKYVHLTAVVHDTVTAEQEIVTAQVDTTFADSARLLARATVLLPQKLAWMDVEYSPAPAKVVTLEKIVEHEVTKTEFKPDVDWILGGIAVGVLGGVWIAHQLK
jgi:DNA-binding transcriptional regulator YdaS (Cro superfamily)